MQKIFLTGERDTGKSSIVDAIAQKYGFFGFKTFFDARENSLFIKFSSGETFPVGYRDEGKMKPVLFGFDRAACIIEHMYLEDKPLVIDEIGFLEESSYSFKEAIIKIVQRASRVLCVLRLSDTPFIGRLKGLQGFQTLELTLNNRDRILKEIIENFGPGNS